MKIIRLSLGFVLLVLTGCTETSEIGANFFKEGNLGIVVTDTLSLHASTAISDSMTTTTPTRLMVGYHDDTELGEMVASSFFQLEPRTADPNGGATIYNLQGISTDYIGVSLVLWYDGYSYYDTSAHQTIYVHELAREIEADDTGALYNTTQTKFVSTPVGQLSFRPKPGTKSSIEIPLSNTLGNEIYALAKIGEDDISIPDRFVEDVLKGFVLRPDITASHAILGFDTKAELRVHYLDRSVVPSEEKYIRFFLSTLRYNQIQAERGSTPLAVLDSQRESLSSNLTGRQAFVQGGDGLSLRIEIPYLRSILIDNPDLILTQAILSLKPVKGSQRKNTPYPPQLKIYAVNHRNEIYADFLSTSDKEGFVNLTEDIDLHRDTYYAVDIISFIQSQMAIEEFNNNALLLRLKTADINSTVNRLYIGDQRSEFDMTLKLHFAFVR